MASSWSQRSQPQKARAVSCGADKTVRVWESVRGGAAGDGGAASTASAVARLEATMVLEGHTAGVNEVSWDPTA